MNAILALVTKVTLKSGFEEGLDHSISSGESSLVNASLNVTDAVTSAAPIALPANLGKRGKPRLERDCKFHRYVMPTRPQKMIL